MLDKAAILASINLATEVINVPELGGDVTVRELTGSERERLYNLFIDCPEGHVPPHYRATLATFGLVDAETGKRLFPDQSVDEVGRLPFGALRAIAKAVERLSRIGEDAETAAGN